MSLTLLYTLYTVRSIICQNQPEKLIFSETQETI